MLNLTFTGKNVAKLEKEVGDNIIQITLGIKPEVNTVALFIRHGFEDGVLSEDEAFDIMDRELKGGRDIIDLINEITETLEKDGFFPKDKIVERLQELAQEEEKKVKKAKK